ncbi:MAG: hypothetical protein WAV95_05340 [Azonexus sp.]
MAEYFGCDEWYQSAFSNKNLSPLADLLDEPLSIVKTVSIDRFDLPVCFGEFDFVAERKHCISYCPECILSGYHGAFHEAAWLYRCPIHGEPVKRVSVDSGHGAYVKKLTELLRGACARWPDVWGAEFESRDVHKLNQLMRWLDAVHDQVTQLRIQNVDSTGDALYSFNNIDTLLGRLDVIEPIPPELIDIIVAPPIRQQQIRVEVKFEAASRIKSISKRFPLAHLLRFYNKYAIVIGRHLSSRLMAIREIERLQKEHAVCCCHWSWDRYVGWEKICPGEKSTTELLCPYKYVIKELKNHWIDFVSSDATPQEVSKFEANFLYACGEVLDNNLGCIPDPPFEVPDIRGLSRYILLPKLTLEKDVEFVLESLLVGQATAHFEQLTTWLSSITNERITHIATTLGNTNLFLSDNAAWVSTWNSLERHSVDPVARWKEGQFFNQRLSVHHPVT